jgi:acetyl esterase/lipase
MAINKVMLAALKLLSYLDVDIRKTYKLYRGINRPNGKGLKVYMNYKIWDHVVLNGEHKIPVRIFSPKDEETDHMLLFFHGGGWVSGNIDTYSKVCFNMARLTKHTVVSVDYRLAPEDKFPIALEDCYAVAKTLYMNKDYKSIKPENITIIGDSAGGNLAAALSLMARDRGEFMPPKQILIYPATGNDYSENSPFDSVRDNGKDYLLTSKKLEGYMDLYMSSEDDRKNPYFSPLNASDFANQPETLIITAEYCPLRDEGEAYGDKLLKAGNKVCMYRCSDALHGYFSLPPQFDIVEKTYKVINEFLWR